jgi:HEAT repeat protein
VIALGKIGIASAEPVIRRAINTVQIEAVGGGREDTAITLRAVAAGALARVDPENAIHDLALMLFDTEPNLEVAYTERVFSKARTREDALDVLADSFEEIPREARVPTILAITGIRSSRTGQTLLRFFDDRDPAVRLAAVQGAVLYRDRQITDRLVLIAQSDPDPRVRAAAQRAMD